MSPRALMAWSSGKDSAWALHRLRTRGELEVVGLLTTMNEAFGRVAMHAVRRELLAEQPRSLGLPLIEVPLPWPCPNEAYEAAMQDALDDARVRLGVTHVAFGDLFLEDVRRYREQRMAAIGMTPVFPIWGLPTAALARDMVDGGLAAVITCIDPAQLAPAFAGRIFDARFLADLPASVDACGERGEFHTFAYAAPGFAHPIAVTVGEVVERDGFVFADVLAGRAD